MIPKEESQHEANELIVCTRCRKKITDAASRFCPYCGRELFPKKQKPRRPNGAGSVYKLPGKRSRPWAAQVAHGTRRWFVGTFATSADAARAVALFKVPDGSVVSSQMTLADVYAFVLRDKEKRVSASSLDTYRAAWKHLSVLADAHITDLKAADYQRIIDGMTDLSRSSCEKVRVLVSIMGNWAVANDVLSSNPAQYLTIPRKEKKNASAKETFDRNDIQLLWADGSDDALIVLATIYTGMRINELFALTPADLHTDGNILYIVGGEKTEAGRNRTVVLNHRIAPVFQRWADQNGAYLLTNSQGGMMNDRNWRVRNYFPLLDRLGIERINPHKARHTFATLVANAGGNPVALQKFLGHADFSTTANIYAHADLQSLSEIAELVD